MEDKRTSSGGKIKYGETDPSSEKVTRNRLSPVRWPVGEEPYVDTPGTEGSVGAQHKDMSEVDEGEWINVKVERHNPKDPPNQRHLLGGGMELKLPCAKCGQPVFTAAEMDAEELLKKAGYKFKAGVEMPKEKVVACVCHVCGAATQLRESFVRMLVK